MNRTLRTGLLTLGFAGLILPAVYGKTQPLASNQRTNLVQPSGLLDGTQPPASPKKPLMRDGTQPPASPKKPLSLDGTQPPASPKKPLAALDSQI